MKGKRYRVFILLLISILSAMFIFNCKSQKGGKVKKVKLRVITWTNPATIDFLESFNKKFQEKYPNIMVDLTHAPTETYEKQMRLSRVTANDVDIVAMQGLVGAAKEYTPGAALQYWELWIKAGILEALDDQSFIKNYKEGAIKSASTYKGKVYSVPTGATAFSGVFYNKDIFKKYNLSIPTTFDEFMTICEVLEANGIIPMSIAGKDIWPLGLPVQAILGCLYPDLDEFNEGLWKESIKFTDEKSVDVLRRMKKMMSCFEPGFQGLDYITVTSRFTSGKVAMLPDGIWQQVKIEQGNPDLNYGYFLLPGSDDPKDNQYLFGKYDLSWGVLARSKNKEAALKWLEMFSEKENYTDYINAVGFIPTQDNIDVKNEFIKEISKHPMKLSWDQVRIGRESVGQYAVDVGFRSHFLKPIGDIEAPEELAKKTQADWDSAKK